MVTRNFRLELVDVDLDGGVTVRRLLLIDERRGVCVDVPDPAAAMIEAMIEEADTDE